MPDLGRCFADGWLIACAKAREHIIVTNEVYRPDIKKRIPICNACLAFRIPYIDTFEMLRRLNIRFS